MDSASAWRNSIDIIITGIYIANLLKIKCSLVLYIKLNDLYILLKRKQYKIKELINLKRNYEMV